MIGAAYERVELIRESVRSRVWRGVRRSDAREVVIKSAAAGVAPQEARARFRNEWFIAGMFSSPRVAKLIELVDDSGEMALVFEHDAELRALDERAAIERPSLAACVRLAIELVAALAEIHAANVVHKDIKPGNLLVDEGYTRVVVIDFGIATIVPRELGRRFGEAGFEGTLGFMAPEQTGRINRAIDHRSDYHALGATLYWMLAGSHPFAEYGEASEVLHAQLTRVPALLSDVDPRVPVSLARIVAKLLRKDANDRYQGSHGLLADLSRCLAQLEGEADPAPFELAQFDPSERLLPPRRLHGRTVELDRLLALHARARAAGPGLAVVRGPSGSGKSALIGELRERIAGPDCLFAACKFDQYTQASPQAGVGQVLRSLLAQLAAGLVPSELLRTRIDAALGSNAGLLAELVPELEALLGPLASPARVGAAQARDRFWDTLERFTETLLIESLDVVLFIDDAQWADASSLRLLEWLCRGRARALTIVLASRDDALADDHPLRRLLAALAAARVELVELELGPLSAADIHAFVDDVLLGSPDSEALAALLHRRTHGTPLFVTQLLMTWYADGIIDMDRSRGQWRVDLDRAAARESSGGVVEFLVERFARLPELTRTSLGVAACIGARFELESLAAAADQSIQAVGSQVWSAVANGYLRVVGAGARSISGDTSSVSDSHVVEYAFVHDRIQQVARESLPLDQRELNLTLARRFSGQVGDPRRASNESLFALAGYIGRARERVTDPEERRRFASSCSEAGLRAKAAAGFTRAAQHFADALALLDGIALDRSAELDVLLEHAECLILAGELGAGERAYTRARARVRDELALARVLLSHVTLAMVPGDTARALELTLEAAAAFDLDLQVGGDAAWFGATLTATMREVEQIGHAAIIRRPLLDDPLQACVCRLLLAATNAAYLAGDIHLYGALACAVVRIGLAHGVDDAVGVGFIQIAIILASGVGDYAATRRYASLAEAVIERVPGSPLRGMFEVIRGSTIQPWVEVMAASIPRLEQAHVRLRADGMLTSAGYAWFCVVMNGYCAGFALPRVVADAERTVAYLDSIGDRPLALATQLYADSAELLGSSELDGPDKLAPLDPEQLAALNPASYFSVHAVQAFTCLLLDDDDGLTAAIAAMGPAVAGGTGLIMWIVHRVVVCLHACARYRVAADDERAELAREIEQELAWLERWQVSCSSNAACWQHLVAAAWAEARAQLEQARREYARAADLAEEVGHHHVVGFANARGARVALALGDRRHAVGFLEHALTGYTRWGARRLERRISEQLRRLGHARPTRTDESTLSGVTGRIHALDVSSIVKMSLALSETTSLAEVIERLLRTTSENAGADRGALLLLRDGAVELHAIQEVGAEVRTFAPPLELDAAAELVASAVIRACIDRGAAVIVDDAQASADAHARASGLRSILALPVDSHGARLGVLYFENHVTPGAFTQQHLRVLNTLAAQAAVILDSARLFAALREREARWRALVDSAPDVILIVDRAHRIELCNRPEFWRGHEHAAIEELFTPEQRERVAAAVDYVFATGKHGSFEATRELPTGQRRVTARLGPIVRDGVIDRVTLIATDITEQRELELQFRQAQKMQAIGTLAGGVAHDFNNLLTVILGACDMGRFDLDDHQLPADALVRTSLVEITEAAERAASLTRQLLAFSRKQVLKPVDFDLDELVSGLARMLRRLLGESITLELRLADRPCWLHADRGQIEQVVMNLAVNARDAMPRGGALTLTTAHHEITSADATDRLAPGRYVALGVHDTGTGISPELVRRIFEPFFTTKEPGKGTGLGLSTVLGIVEQSGGKIDVDTRLGRGTSFRVLLPAARERELALADDEPELPRGYETLLVVEDDAPVRSLVVQMLASLGYRVLEAGEGEAATQAARAQTELDLALVDLVLPGASGREVGELLTRLHPRVKLLYTSGYIDDAFNPNRSDLDLRFVHKPFNRAQLARAVRRLLDGEL